jgi:hypothetical protein
MNTFGTNPYTNSTNYDIYINVSSEIGVKYLIAVATLLNC